MSRSVPTAAPTSVGLVAVFDFDHTITDANTDTYFVDVLKPEHRALYKQPYTCWTDLMDSILGRMHADGFSSEQIRQSLHSVRIVSGGIGCN